MGDATVPTDTMAHTRRVGDATAPTARGAGTRGVGRPPGYPSAPPPAAEYPYGPAGAPGYGYPPGGYQAGPAPTRDGVPGYAPRQTDSKAVIALILSITSWALCGLVIRLIFLLRAIANSGITLDGSTEFQEFCPGGWSRW